MPRASWREVPFDAAPGFTRSDLGHRAIDV